MSTKFFNNTPGNTLFNKLKGIASGMTSFDRFLAVVGFFRSSGKVDKYGYLKSDVQPAKAYIGNGKKLIDNINKTLKGDFVTELRRGSKVAIAASCFSIYIFPNSIPNLYTIYYPRGTPVLNPLY